MLSWFEQLAVSDNIVHVAAMLYLAGFLFRNQLILRLLIIAGDFVYILYFYFAPATPLWGGIFWSAMFTLVNAVMIALIAADRLHFRLDANERKLFDMLEDLTPGQFRKFVHAGRYEVATARKIIAMERKPMDRLYFVLDGNISVEKSGRRAFSDSRTFIGEVAFLLASPSPATVTLEQGCSYFVWNVKPLHRLLQGKPALQSALSAVMNKKLACKVATAGVMMDTVVLGNRLR